MSQQLLIEQVYALTQSIAHAAALSDWAEAARLAEVRSPLLMSIGAKQDAASLDLVGRIQALDAGILANAQTSQTELKAEYGAAMSRIKSVSTYQRIASL